MLKGIGPLSVFVVFVFHTLAFAHGGETHIMGTVTALDKVHVEVKTRDGKNISILLNKETQYRKGTAAATSADLKVGDRVVVHATGKGDTVTADEIHFSPTGTAKGHEEMMHSPMQKGAE